VQRVVSNTLAILDVVDADVVPVAAGATKPLIEAARNSSEVHGVDGLGDLRLPESTRSSRGMCAIDLLRTTLSEAHRPVTIVSLAPMTNIALLVSAYPGLIHKIDRILFMGGSIGRGNATAVAEFNVWHDPEAAQIVLNSGASCAMYGLDVFEKVVVSRSEALEMTRSASPATAAAGKLLSYTSSGSDLSVQDHFGLLGDAGALCALVNPSLVESSRVPVLVNLAPGPGRGQTIVDLRTSPGEDSLHGTKVHTTDVDVMHSVNPQAMIDLFSSTLAGSNPGQPITPASEAAVGSH